MPTLSVAPDRAVSQSNLSKKLAVASSLNRICCNFYHYLLDLSFLFHAFPLRLLSSRLQSPDKSDMYLPKVYFI